MRHIVPIIKDSNTSVCSEVEIIINTSSSPQTIEFHFNNPDRYIRINAVSLQALLALHSVSKF